MSRKTYTAQFLRDGRCSWSDHGEPSDRLGFYSCGCRVPDPEELIRAEREAEMKAEAERQEEEEEGR